jgi:hypothetical protein
MSDNSATHSTTVAVPGGNVYVGPSLTSSLVRFVAALATARP